MPQVQTLHCTVAVPNRQLFDGEIYYASIPSVEGQYGILPNHEMILSLNSKGGLCTLHLNEDGSDKKEILLYDGIAQVFDNKLTVLGRLGKLTERIHLDEMKERAVAQEKLVEDLRTRAQSDSDKAILAQEESRLEWYMLQVDWATNNS